MGTGKKRWACQLVGDGVFVYVLAYTQHICLSVCLFVCECTGIYLVPVCVCMVCVCVHCVQMCVTVCSGVCVCAFVCSSVFVCVSSECVRVQGRESECVVCVCMHVCLHVCMYVCA